MGKIDRHRRRLLGAGALGAALIFAVLLLRREETPITSTPAAPPTAAVSVTPAPPAPDAQATGTPRPQNNAPIGVRQSYIVQASRTDLARRAVERAGGIVIGELDIIRAVGAELNSRELATLQNDSVEGLRVYDDATVTA